MSEKSENELKIMGIYEELKGVLNSISTNSTTWFDDEGFINQANATIERVKLICPEINDADYKIKGGYIPERGPIVNVVEAKSKLNALIGRIKGTYKLDSLLGNNGHTFIQNQSQVQSQYISTVLELHEKIINELPKYSAGTKERGFLEKLKSVLPTLNSMTGILASALKIGAECGLDPIAIHKLLGL